MYQLETLIRRMRHQLDQETVWLNRLAEFVFQKQQNQETHSSVLAIVQEQ